MHRDLPLNFFMERYTESFAANSNPLCRRARRQANAVTGIDGRIPVVMALAARKSYDEHRPVRLEEVTA